MEIISRETVAIFTVFLKRLYIGKGEKNQSLETKETSTFNEREGKTDDEPEKERALHQHK